MDFGTFSGSSDPNNENVTAGSLPPHRKMGTVFVALLPWLDEQPTYEIWTEDRYPILHDGSYDSPHNSVESQLTNRDGYLTLATRRIGLFQCPAAPYTEAEPAANHYVSNNGMYHRSSSGAEAWTITRKDGTTTNVDFAESMAIANGIFNNKFPGLDAEGNTVATGPMARMDDIADGFGNTVLFSENLQAQPWYRAGFIDAARLKFQPDAPEIRYPLGARFTQGMVWHYEDNDKIDGASVVMPVHRINGGDPLSVKMDRENAADLARPSSAHVDGVNMSMADGGTRFVTNSIDYRVYQALMTPQGQHSNVPNRD